MAPSSSEGPKGGAGTPPLGDQRSHARECRRPTAQAGRPHLVALSAELFVFAKTEPALPSRTPAERSLRHLVTSRKISGGTRSAKGTATKMALSSLFGTWRLHGLDPLVECRALLAAPQV